MISKPLYWLFRLRYIGFLPRFRPPLFDRRRAGLAACLFVVLFLIEFPHVASAGPPIIGVLYPDVPPPYQNIFLNVISGISDTDGAQVEQYVLGDDFKPDAVQAWLNNQHIDIIIALGRRGLAAANQAGGGRAIVSGALLLTTEDEERNMVGISLAADPQPLFAKLLSLIPTIERIHVVYDPQQNAWTMALARKAAAAFNVKLVAYQADSLRQAVFYYNEIVHKAGSRTDAVWLPIDSTTVNDQVVLPLILREAWDRNLAVISNNPSYASKGALISTLPDNVALGRRLAGLALRINTDGMAQFNDGARILPLEALKFAINRRTADHLGLAFTADRQRDFDFVFPAR